MKSTENKAVPATKKPPVVKKVKSKPVTKKETTKPPPVVKKAVVTKPVAVKKSSVKLMPVDALLNEGSKVIAGLNDK